MKSYRDQYDDVLKVGATIIAVSGDGPSVQAKFRRTIGAAFSFVSDPDATLIGAYGAKVPLFKRARRVTYVIGQDGRIARVDTGADAIDSANAVGACTIG